MGEKIQKILIFLFITSLAYSQEMPEIIDIQITGNKYIEDGFIYSLIGVDIGDKLSPTLTSDILKKLYKTGLFKDVKVTATQTEYGVSLLIKVMENPILDSVIIYKRDKRLSRKKTNKILEKLEIDLGQFLSDKDIFDIKKKLEEKYKKYKVDIDKFEENGRVYLVIRMSKKKIYRFGKITIYGEKRLKEKDLKKALKLTKRKWLLFKEKKKFSEFELDNALLRLDEYFKKHGFMEAEVKSVKLDTNKNRVDLSLEIFEGKRYYFGDFSIEGAKAIPEKVLSKQIKIKKSKPYNPFKIQKSIQNIAVLYADLGYMRANIRPEEEIKDTIVNIKFKINEGNKMRVRKILIVNNTKTFDKVIRRELVIFPGDVLSRDKIIMSQRKIFSLNYFDNVEVQMRETENEDEVDLIFKVYEKKFMGNFSVGASYSKEQGIAGYATVTMPNFRGRGEEIRFTATKGEKINDLTLGYTKPWIFDTPLTVGLDFFITTRRYIDFTKRRRGIGLSLSRPLPWNPYTKIFYYHNIEMVKVNLYDTTNISPYMREQLQNRLQNLMRFVIKRDSRDNPFNPRVGTLNLFSFDFAGIFGDVYYRKIEFENCCYNRLYRDFYIMLRYRFGAAFGDVPIYERFLLGGAGVWGVRGYRDYSIGIPTGTIIMGGRYAVCATIEIKYAPKTQKMQTFYPLIFFDAGNTSENLFDLSLTKMKIGAGIGIRMELPMIGVIGIDYGYGFNRPEKRWRDRWELHFQGMRMF